MKKISKDIGKNEKVAKLNPLEMELGRSNSSVSES